MVWTGTRADNHHPARLYRMASDQTPLDDPYAYLTRFDNFERQENNKMTYYTIARWKGDKMISEQEFSFDTLGEALINASTLAIGTSLTELIVGDKTYQWRNGWMF